MGSGCGILLLIGGALVAISMGNEWIIYLVVGGVLVSFILAVLAHVMDPTGGASAYDDYAPGDGPAFERHVQQRLSRAGYFVRNTGASSDYGVDLIAARAGRTIAIQAKNYAKPVGVRAVQEVNAGKAHHRADEAWVVSRSGFTKQAKALARSTDVKLVDVNTL